MKKPMVVVVVSGGVAEAFFAEDAVDVVLIDYDNEEQDLCSWYDMLVGPGQRLHTKCREYIQSRLPSRFANLLKENL